MVRLSRLFGRILLLSLLAGGLAGCSKDDPGPGPGPTPPTVTPPTMSCPADISADTLENFAFVQYPAPTVTGGAAPVTTACTVPQGSAFPLGNTDVVCTATDAMQQRAQCVFHVKVAAIPQLKSTKFLAFGDSITCCEIAPPITVQVTDPDHSYATVLATMIRARYKAQAIAFNRASVGGSKAISDEQQQLLVDSIDNVRPEVLLLLTGTNDVNDGIPVSLVSSALRADMVQARQRGVRTIFLATLLPQIPGLQRAFNPEGIPPMNDEIRRIAATDGAVLVDLYAAVFPNRMTLIGDDGLHPTVAGAQVIADTFLAAIKANLE